MAFNSALVWSSARSRNRDSILFVVLAVGWLLLTEGGVFGQTPTATLTGLVEDPSRAVVPAAKLTLMNIGTGISKTENSALDGYYTFPFLLPGTYQLTVEHTGFETLVRKDIRLDVQATVRLELVLQLGTATQEVTVSAAPPMLQQDTSSLSQLVSQNQVADLPLLGRNAYALVQTTPCRHHFSNLCCD
jgi:hypothetical protein